MIPMLHYTTTFLAVFWSIVYLVCLVGTPLLGLVGGVLVVASCRKLWSSRKARQRQDHAEQAGDLFMGVVVGIVLLTIAIAGAICLYPIPAFTDAPKGSAYATIHHLAELYLISYGVTLIFWGFIFWCLVVAFVLAILRGAYLGIC